MLHFLHFVFKGFDIFTINILNSFSDSLPISSSFIWTSVFLVWYFICVVFLCLFIISLFLLTYCVWGFLFPGFKVQFFLPFGFCPPKVGPVVWVSFVQGEICAELLFAFSLMSKAEWGLNPVCWWLGLYFCCVCCLDESCTGCYWWLGDAGPCITVIFFVWVLTIWYPLGLVLW